MTDVAIAPRAPKLELHDVSLERRWLVPPTAFVTLSIDGELRTFEVAFDRAAVGLQARPGWFSLLPQRMQFEIEADVLEQLGG